MNVLDTVGNTPLLELKKIYVPESGHRNVRIFVKAEYLNASGSVKDRAAKSMIIDGIQKGRLTKGRTIIDATSGNTGIAYAMIGAYLGFPVKLCMPANVTFERKAIMRSYGAEIVETDPLEGIDGAYSRCREIVKKNPDGYFYPDQYSNEMNWKAHYFGTGKEIISQTQGKITHFVAGTGTSGTFVGCTRRLKEFCPDIKCYNVSPDSPFHGIEGLKHYSVLKDGFFDESISDGLIEISTEESFAMSKKLAKTEGLFVGISSGANVAAAVKIAQNAPDGSVIVTVLCDGGYRYISQFGGDDSP